MANTETIETKKATALEENTDVADADLFLVGNAGTSVLRKLKWSNILAAVKKKLSKVASSGSYNDLEDKPGVVSTKADGLAPKRGGTTTKFLRDDGTWAVPPDNDTKPVGMKGATTSAAGSAGYAPAPAAGAANRYLRSDGTWQVPPDNNTTYGNMKGATTSAAGGAGLAPAPAAGAANRYLRSDGTWQVPPDHDTVYSHPDEHPASMITQDATHRFVSDTEKSTWNGKMNTTGNGSNLTAAFSQAASRTNLTSGEKLSILLGKIAKWFADLKAHAFSDLIQSATSTSTTQAVSAAVAKNLQDQITEQNTKFPTLSGHTLRFDNGIQIYFMQLVQLTDNDANGYYKYFNFDQPFKDNLYCVQATNNTSNERVYMDNAYTAENRLLVRCASSVWVYVMCIGYWK